MKNVMSIIKSGVGFALLAVLITVMVLYFNRGKDATTQQMDNVLSIVEGTELSVVNLASYDGKTIKGSSVVSIIEGLSASNISTPVYVFTNGKNSYAVYTDKGASASDTAYSAGTITIGGKGYSDFGATSASFGAGSYKVKTNSTYINPSLTYAVKCHYNDNKTIACVTIVQQ